MRAPKIAMGLVALLLVAMTAACSSASTAGKSAGLSVLSPTARPAAAPAPGEPAPHLAMPLDYRSAGLPCTATAVACVDLTTQQAWLLYDGYVIYGPVAAMPGSPVYPTPTGTFHVLDKVIDYHSTEFNNAPMPYSVFFYPGDAFHVGSPQVFSHGCVHLSWSAAQTFFQDLSVGDEVQIVA